MDRHSQAHRPEKRKTTVNLKPWKAQMEITQLTFPRSQGNSKTIKRKEIVERHEPQRQGLAVSRRSVMI